jgi:hypothetical protein
MYLLFLHPKMFDFLPKNQLLSEFRLIEINGKMAKLHIF